MKYIEDKDWDDMNATEEQVVIPSTMYKGTAYDTGAGFTEKARARMGFENETEGLGDVFVENIVASSKGIAGSIATTFGNTEFGALMEADVQQNLDYDEKELKFDSMQSFLGSTPAWLAQSTGAALPDVAGAITIGAITAGAGAPAIVGTSLFSFSRMQGANFRMMRKWRPDASLDDIRAASLVLTAVQTGAESMFSLEALGASKLGTGAFKKMSKDVFGEMAETGTFKAASHIINKSKNRFVAAGIGGVGEVFEEQLQGGAEIIAGMTFGNQDYNKEDLAKALLLDPLRALPTGSVMGGVFHSAKQTGDAAKSQPEVTEDVEKQMFGLQMEDGQWAIDEGARQKDNDMFSALEKELEPVLGKSANAAMEQIKSMAYAMSFSAQVNNKQAIMPADFIADLKIGYVDSKITKEDVAQINAIRKNGELGQEEKSEAILSYIDSRYGKESPIYQSINGVGEMVEASEIASDNEAMIDQYSRYAPKLHPEANKAWISGLAEKVSSAQGLGIIGRQVTGSTIPLSMTYNEAADAFSREDVARIFIDEPIIDINGEKYVVSADAHGITFTDAADVETSRGEMLDAYIESVREERKGSTSIGSQQTLAREKLTHGILESKYIIGEVLAAYDNRLGKLEMDEQVAKTGEAIEQSRISKQEADELNISNVAEYEEAIAGKSEASIGRTHELSAQMENLKSSMIKKAAVEDASGITDGVTTVEVKPSPAISEDQSKELTNRGVDTAGLSASQASKLIEMYNEQDAALGVADVDSAEAVRTFAERIAAGEQLVSDEDAQFYQNNAQAIEAELQNIQKNQELTGWHKEAADKARADGAENIQIDPMTGGLMSNDDGLTGSAFIIMEGKSYEEAHYKNLIRNKDSKKLTTDAKKKVDAKIAEYEAEGIGQEKKASMLDKQAAPLIAKLNESLVNKDRIESMWALNELHKLYNSYGQEFDAGQFGVDTGARFEASSLAALPVKDLSDEEIETAARSLGLEPGAFWEPMHWPNILDPQNNGNFTVMADQTIADALEIHRAKKWDAPSESKTSSSVGLFETDGSIIKGMYMPRNRTALFFKGAGVETAIHEFVHHAQSLLPIDMQAELVGLYNEQTNSNNMHWDEASEEWFARTMTKWIVNKQPPVVAEDPRMGAFVSARKIVMSAYKDFKLSPETKAGLDEIFGEVQDQDVVLGATQAIESMVDQDPPTMEMVSSMIAGREGSRYSSKEELVAMPDGSIDDSVRFDLDGSDINGLAELTAEERNKLSGKIHAIAGSHEEVKATVKRLYGDVSFADITDDEMIVLSEVIGREQVVNDDDVIVQAKKDGATILDWTMNTFTKNQTERNRASDPASAKMLSNAVRAIRNGGIKALYTVSTLPQMTKILDDLNDTGLWHNIVYSKIKAGREVRKSVEKKYIEMFAKKIRESGVDMYKFPKRKVALADGLEYTNGEVAFMAVINRMRPQDVDSFIKSNYAHNLAEGRKVLAMADGHAKTDAEMGKFIDNTQFIYEAIHEELAAEYKKATGRDMGKLNWYMPFVRMDGWDDADALMSQLNYVDAKGENHYRSVTTRMQERKGGTSGRIDISDPFSATTRYINQASAYIGMANTVKQVGATLGTTEVENALRWKFGEGSGKGKASWKTVHNIMTELVRGELYHDARTKPMSEYEMVFRNARARFSLFALGGNLTTVVKQTLSAPLGLSRSGMPIETTLRATGELLSLAPKAIHNSIINTSRVLSGRVKTEGLVHLLAGTRIYDAWDQHSQVLLSRHGNPETGEAMNYNFKGVMGLDVHGQPLGEILMSGISAMDALVVGTLWGATHDSWVRANRANGMSEVDAIKDAALKADMMVEETQPPSLPQDRNLLQRQNEAVKTLFMFTGASFKQYEVFATEVAGRSYKALSRLKSQGIGSVTDVLFKGDNLQTGLAQQIGIGFVIPAILMGMMSRKRKPTEREALFDIMAYPFTALPMVRGLAGVAAGVETTGAGEVGNYLDAMYGEIFDGIEAVGKATYGGEWTGRNIQEAMDGLSMTIGAPKIFGRVMSAGAIKATGKGTFLEPLKEQYFDPWDETKEF